MVGSTTSKLRFVVIGAVVSCFFAACAHQQNVPTPSVAQQSVLKREKKYSEKLEQEKLELELQNALLVKALNERKKVVIDTPHGRVVQQFPQFEELIYDQAKTAYQEKDLQRLAEAVRILKANQPQSHYLETLFFWLAHLQQFQGQSTQALLTYDEFIKNFPDSQYVPQAMYLKAEIYQKINLRKQALLLYNEIKKQYPNSKEKHLADAKLKEFKRNIQ